NFKPLKMLRPGQPVTLVYLGVQKASFWTEREWQEFQSLIYGGGRGDLGVFSGEEGAGPGGGGGGRYEEGGEKKRGGDEGEKKKKRVDDEEEKEKADERTKKAEKKKKTEEEEKEDAGLIPFDDIAKRLGFHFAFPPKDEPPVEHRQASLVEAGGKLEPELTWH